MIRFRFRYPLIAALVAASGCVTETTRVEPVERLAGASDIVGPDGQTYAGNAGVHQSLKSHVVTQILPLGNVPYDNMTLPLASPDARYVVTQTGIPPSWETVLALPGATVPHTTRLEIYDVSEAPETPPA
ncbi:MAG: hypothetical protein GY715_20240, partial [Planctomycetes bacterium]|nr:hypothetical protein [Planctomycetota bacterium]